MFENLSDKLQRVYKNLRGEGKLTPENIQDALRDIRMALLEADVHFKVEAADSNEEEFGEERLMERVRESSAASAADLRDAIMQSVTRFCREDFADDATLLTVVVDRPLDPHETAIDF